MYRLYPTDEIDLKPGEPLYWDGEKAVRKKHEREGKETTGKVATPHSEADRRVIEGGATGHGGSEFVLSPVRAREV
jgi:hypothetical protein